MLFNLGMPSKRSRDDGDAGQSTDAKRPRVDEEATPATRSKLNKKCEFIAGIQQYFLILEHTLKDSTSIAPCK